MTLRTYDSNEVSMSFAGLNIDSGYDEGEFCAIAYNGDAFTLKVGTDGSGTRSKTNNRSAKITIKLMQSSSSNDDLSALHNKDLTQPGGAGVGAFMLRDRQGNTLVRADHAWISKTPDQSFGAEASGREWVLETEKLDSIIGGNLVIP